jgi:hypothetical protein
VSSDVGAGQFRRAEITANSHREAEGLLMGLGRRVPLRCTSMSRVSWGVRMLVPFDR